MGNYLRGSNPDPLFCRRCQVTLTGRNDATRALHERENRERHPPSPQEQAQAAAVRRARDAVNGGRRRREKLKKKGVV